MEHRISSSRTLSGITGSVTNPEFSMSNAAPANAVSSPLNGKVHPLRSLMDSWEREGLDEEESDSELLWLSGMIDRQFFGASRD